MEKRLGKRLPMQKNPLLVIALLFWNAAAVFPQLLI